MNEKSVKSYELILENCETIILSATDLIEVKFIGITKEINIRQTENQILKDEVLRANEALLVFDAEKLKEAGGENADVGKFVDFKDKVLGFLQKGYLKVDEATKLFEKAGISGVEVKDLGNGAFEFNKTIKEFVQNGVNYINEGSTGVKAVPKYESKTRNLFESASALYYEVKKVIESNIEKLDEALKQVRDGSNPERQRYLVNQRRVQESRIDLSTRQFGGIIPEYHSQGLPVGFKSRGTDTVPAMLTPGEYVLRKKVVDSLGTNFLNNLNKYGVNALQTMNKSTIINNVYNTNNAKISQNIDNKSQYLNGMFGVDKLMRYV